MNIISKRSVLLAAISALSFTLGCPPVEVGNDAGDDPTPDVQTDGGVTPNPDPGPGNEPAVITDCDDTPAVTTDPGADICEVTVGTGGTLIVGDILPPAKFSKAAKSFLTPQAKSCA
ncbi:MAG: hypothetical protein GY822_18760 [Deltaproteobacteria bacterium]|nr:hypothetical protein [Deltaproteobacteria bacterium]